MVVEDNNDSAGGETRATMSGTIQKPTNSCVRELLESHSPNPFESASSICPCLLDQNEAVHSRTSFNYTYSSQVDIPYARFYHAPTPKLQLDL